MNTPMEPRRPTSPAGSPAGVAREQLMREHRALTLQRQAVPLGGEEYQRIAKEIARVEVAIAAAEEPAPSQAPTERPAPGG